MLALAPIWQVPLRVAVVYTGLLVLLRLRGKKELGRLSPMDLLSMLLLSETVSPAMTQGDSSLEAAGLAAVTLITMSYVSARASYRSRTVERLLEGAPEVLIDDGRVDARTKSREAITDQELEGILRQAGVESPSEVRRAVVETSGEVSILKRRRDDDTGPRGPAPAS